MLPISKLLRRCSKPLVSSVRHYQFEKNFIDKLKLYPEPMYSYMPNGITIATEDRPGLDHACIGLFIDGGSRYESQLENGIAHFFEHIAYRSTLNRSAALLRKQMDCVGARFRCFTTREIVVYYVQCLSADVTLVMDLLTDCVFNNEMNVMEIEKQKDIVYREMIDKEVDATAVLFDYLHGAAFFGTPLAQTVMGPTGNLHNYNEQAIRTYVDKYFDPSRVVLAAVGGICHQQIVDLAHCYLLRMQPSKCSEEYYRFTAGDFRFRDDALPYCDTTIAFEAPCFCDDRRWIMDIAATFLGSWDCSQPGGSLHANKIAQASLLADLAYGYDTFYIKYKDTGLWGVHFLANKMEVDSMVYNIQNSFMYLCLCLTKNELDRAKNQLKTELMTRLEGVTNSCMDLGRWTLYYGRRMMLHEQLREIDIIKIEDVHATCEYFLYDRCPVVASVGPVEALPHNSRIRAGQYWLRT